MALLPDYGDRPLLRNPYFLLGAGAVLTGIIFHWRSIRRSPPPIVEAQPPKPGGVSLWATDFNQAQADAFQKALPEMGQKYAPIFVQAGREVGVSPIILAALMERETGYGKGCKLPECRGYSGRDFGLMQINKDAHPDFFTKTVGGVPAYQVPVESVRYGARVLKDLMGYFSRQGQGTYTVGAKKAALLATTPGKKPDKRPLEGSDLFWAAIAAYNAGQGNVMQAFVSDRSFDAVTTKGDYGRNVLDRADRILQSTNAVLGGAA